MRQRTFVDVARLALALPVAEFGLDALLHLGDVEIADDGQRGALGAIIRIVEGAQIGSGNAANTLDIGLHALTQSRIRQGGLQVIGDPAPVGIVAQLRLAQQDAALALDRFGIEGELARHFANDIERRLHRLVLGVGQGKLVSGVVERGFGIGIGAEGQAQPLKHGEQIAFGNIGRTVEGHVFNEMGRAVLRIGFLAAADFDGEADRRLAHRIGVALKCVAHSIRQHAENDIGIGRDVGARYPPGRDAGRRRNGRARRRRPILRRCDGRLTDRQTDTKRKRRRGARERM